MHTEDSKMNKHDMEVINYTEETDAVDGQLFSSVWWKQEG